TSTAFSFLPLAMCLLYRYDLRVKLKSLIMMPTPKMSPPARYANMFSPESESCMEKNGITGSKNIFHGSVLKHSEYLPVSWRSVCSRTVLSYLKCAKLKVDPFESGLFEVDQGAR